MVRDIAAEIERVRAAAIRDAARLMAEDPNSANLASAFLAAEAAANLIATGWTREQAGTISSAYRDAIAQEIADARHAGAGGGHVGPPTPPEWTYPEQGRNYLPQATQPARPKPIEAAKADLSMAAKLEAQHATRSTVGFVDLLVDCAFRAGQADFSYRQQGWSDGDALELARHFQARLMDELSRVHDVRDGAAPISPLPGQP